MDLHVFPIPILPPTSHPTPSLWRWKISFCFSLDVSCSLQSEQLPGGRVQKRRGEGENGTWNLLLETFSVSGTWSDQLLKSAIQRLDREMMFHFIDEESELQFDSASSSQLPSGMVQLWEWNQDSDQKWGISWLNLPSLHSFLNTFPPFLPPFHLPFLFLLSWDK